MIGFKVLLIRQLKKYHIDINNTLALGDLISVTKYHMLR